MPLALLPIYSLRRRLHNTKIIITILRALWGRNADAADGSVGPATGWAGMTLSIR